MTAFWKQSTKNLDPQWRPQIMYSYTAVLYGQEVQVDRYEMWDDKVHCNYPLKKVSYKPRDTQEEVSQ